MVAHGKTGHKFGRKTDQRRALMRGLMCSLIKYQTIETTLARAKVTRREAEKLISLARKGGLSNRRIVIARLNDLEAATLLMDVVAPQIQRDSGYLRIERTGFRRGDNAEMGTISFVDDIDLSSMKDASAAKSTAKKSSEAKKNTTESSAKEDK